MDQAMKLARKLASFSPLAVRYCKEAVARSLDVDLQAEMLIERDLFALSYASKDQKEGMTAFLEKRTAAFTGR